MRNNFKAHVFLNSTLSYSDIRTVMGVLVDGMYIDHDDTNGRWYLSMSATNTTDRDYLRHMLKTSIYPVLKTLGIKFTTQES